MNLLRKFCWLAPMLFGLAVPCVVPAASAAALDIPPLAYRQRVLPNGLRVVAVEDRSSPTVSIQVWYQVGAKDDPPGRSGFAHLFEHLMFKGTRLLEPEQFDRLTEDVGGFNNASTGDDYTNYFEVVPSHYLESLLWAEAQRMGDLRVDQAAFASERAVVEEEFRLRVLAEPYGRLFNSISKHSYQVHPYRRPAIGSLEDLRAASLDDVVAFHRTFYRPDNATLIVVGDFDAVQLDAWIDRYFGPIPQPSQAIPRVTVQEPARTRNREYIETAPGVPLPALVITWLAPPAASPDAPALEVAAALLAKGESSRLNQALVYRGQFASTAGFEANLRVDTGLLIAYAIAAGGNRASALGPALLKEIARLGARPVGSAELDKVKTQLLTQALIERQTALGKGMALGHALLVGGDLERVNKDLVALQAVTAADVQRVVRKYLLNAPRVSIAYRQLGQVDQLDAVPVAGVRP